MTDDEVLAGFRDAGALLEGHFILSSGRRSPAFPQKMLVFQDPVRTERLCGTLAVEADLPGAPLPEPAALPPVKPGSHALGT